MEARALHFAPCLPANWPGFKLRYRCQGATCAIAVNKVDGSQPGVRVWLVDDLQSHTVAVRVTRAVV